MFLYVCLLLLPAAALAVCNDNGVMTFFDLVDADNNDAINRPEAYAIFDALDIDNDLLISLQEAKVRGAILAPSLKGHVEKLFNFLDADKDGFISYCDVEQDFGLIDTNKNGVKSRKEYQIILEKICGGYKPFAVGGK